MQQVEPDLCGGAGTKLPRLHCGGIGADHDFAVLKGEDIRSTGNSAEFFMKRSHPAVADNQDVDASETGHLRGLLFTHPHQRTCGLSESLQAW